MRSPTLRAVVALTVALVVIVSIIAAIVLPAAGGAVAVWIGLPVLVAVTVTVFFAAARGSRGIADTVNRLRPHAHVIPAFSTAATVDQARALGVSTRGLSGAVGTPVALVVLDDHIEVWAGRGDREPRWVVRRVPGGASVVSARYGQRYINAVQVTDGTADVTVIPAYRAVAATTGFVGADIDRAITELTA